MKKTIYLKLLLVLFGIALISNYCYSNIKKEFIITGNIKGFPNNVRMALIKGDNREPSDTLCHSISKDGNFQFKVDDLIIGKVYFIILDKTSIKLSSTQRNWIRFIIESPITIISGDMEKWPIVLSSGGTDVYEKWQEVSKQFAAKINPLFVQLSARMKSKSLNEMRKLSANDTSLTAKNFIRISNHCKEFIEDFVKKNANSFATPLVIKESFALSLEEKAMLYKALPTETKNSYYGKQLNTFLGMESLKNSIGLGKQIPDFNLTTPEGKVVSIKRLTSKNKLTLIDFWASWCSPCRAAIPHLKAVYHEFKGRGFSIVGIVTAKNDKDAPWKKAVLADQTPWPQGMDMNNTSDLYFPKIAIPGFLLVDSDGKIIASDLIDGGKGLGAKGPKITGADLNKTLIDLLK